MDAERLRSVFDEVAGEDGSIDAKELARALKIDDPLLAERIFAQFDTDGSGHIEVAEFLDAVEALADGDPEARVRFAFRLHDIDGSGEISRDELDRMLQSSLLESGLHIPPEQVDALVDALFAECDTDRSGQISEQEFSEALARWPDLRDALAVGPVSWLDPRPGPDGPKQVPEPPLSNRLRNKAAMILGLGIWGLVNLGFFLHAVKTHEEANLYVQIARGCGACLNFNGALILLPMCRNFLTWLRRRAFGHWLPLDESVDFHRLAGNAMFVFGVIHTVAHLLNYATLAAPVSESLLRTHAGLSGLVLLILFTVMTVTAQNFVRRRGHFELFYFAHLLYLGWFALMLIHGPRFWMFALVPLLGFAVDRGLSATRKLRPAVISAGRVLASGVTELVISRPQGFKYQPGAYVFAQIPEIAKHEWHPFTISSAPERPNHLTLHIRSAGNWTRGLHEYYQEAQGEGHEAKIYLDGPYGTPAVHIFQSKVAVLVGAGIGVTPFASILESLILRRQAGTLDGVEAVWFYWINRHQAAFEWFASLLNDVEEGNEDGFFKIRIFMSGMQARSDLKSATLHIAMDIHHKQTKIDLVTGLRSRTQGGRPDWDVELPKIAAAHPGIRPEIFLCGPAGLATQVQAAALRHGFGFRREHF
jgi:predicted ferric reductase/Ca2+-binding EF-hand superfamily protein